MKAFERSIELDPENKWAWFHKAETLAYLARRAYKKAGQPGIAPLKHEYYNLIQKATGKCLDGNGSSVYMHHPNSGDFQLWKAIEISPGTIILKHFWSGKVLEATEERGTYFSEDTNSLSQQWIPEDIGNGYQKIKHVITKLLLHADSDKDVKLQPDGGGDFQIWRTVQINIILFTESHQSQSAAEILVFEQ